MKYLVFIASIIALLVSCKNGQKSQELDLPTFEIENQDLTKNYVKASFDIRLYEKITKGKLEEIANYLKSEHYGFQRYFITYYLPEMAIGSGAWATSHFNEELSVRILGSTKEEDQKIGGFDNPDGEVVGRWKSNVVGFPSRSMIFIKGSKTYFRQIFKDGSFGDDEISSNEKKYTHPNDPESYMLIESNGNLCFYSPNGKYEEMVKY
ncbi:MAG: hypothetical protein WBA23_21690 [Tunicatimonas sp.]|uniref:hypothetical protein n=1 Tax=Tunicatimonas sp. TaxID=1940096 RepID=UPI003C72BDB0